MTTTLHVAGKEPETRDFFMHANAWSGEESIVEAQLIVI
jgi:hypothetical protein